MIVFDLKCGKGHVFEAWFRDNATFETQCNGRKVECPVCGGTKIEPELFEAKDNHFVRCNPDIL